MGSKVFFVASENYKDIERIGDDLRTLIKTSRLLEVIEKNSLVGIKLTFGEKENKGYIDPRLVKVVVDKIKSSAAKPFLTDANVIYHGRRMQAVDHLAVAYEHGFEWKNIGCPLIIADGLCGENAIDVEINKRHIKKARIAGVAFYLDYLVSLAHFTGHMFTGFAASLKNIGMGFASRAGKLQQHSNIKPKVIEKNCKVCKLCIAVCPNKAIVERNNRVSIQENICIGCGDCLVACKFEAIEVTYTEAVEILGEKMVEYAYGVLKNIKTKVFFNFLVHITKECDCLARDDPSVIPDIGILASEDPVAVDKAGLDLIFEKTSGKDIFKALHPGAGSAIQQLHYAQDIGLGKLDYELVKLDYK